MMEELVTGVIYFDKNGRSFSNATVYIRLEDVTYIDKGSMTVAEKRMTAVSIDIDQAQHLPFTLHGSVPARKANLILTVHIDVNNSGKISKGDFLTIQSYPVFLNEITKPLQIQVVQY